MARRYYSNCLPGESKNLDGTLYLVSPNGNWLRQTERKSKKAAHRAAVKAKKEKKSVEKAAQKLLLTGEVK